MGTIKMTFIDLISLQIPGFKLRNSLGNLLPQDTALHAQLSTKACTYLEVTMGPNSLTTSTASTSKQTNGFKSTLSELETHLLETATSFSALKTQSSCSAEVLGTQNQISSNSASMSRDGRMFSVTKE